MFFLKSIKIFFLSQVIGSLVPLGLICLIVTFGNILVISAVRWEQDKEEEEEEEEE